MGVVLCVLKIILIVLGAVLGTALLLIVLLLFNSFRYEASGSKENELRFNSDFKWLFGILKGYYSISGGVTEYAVTLPFGIKLLSYSSEPDLSYELDNENLLNDEPFYDDESGVKNKKRSIADRLRAVFGRIKDFVTSVKEKIRLVQSFNTKYNIKSLTEATYRLIRKLLKNIGFRRLEVAGTMGFDNPAGTGAAIGAISAVSALLPFSIDIRGNFEQKELTGNFRLKGRTNLFRILFPIALYVFTRPVWPLARDYWKGDLYEL